MYVASLDGDITRYRVEAGDTVVAPITSLPRENLLFMASVDGYAYCVQELTGEIIWRFSAGAPITSSAMPVGDGVYVISDDGGMFKVDLYTGSEEWWAPRVSRFLAATPNRVYCTDRIGRLLILDAKSGGRIATLATEQLDLFIPNYQTDRIYVGTKTGLIQCFREAELERALIYSGPGTEKTETIQVKTGGDEPRGGRWRNSGGRWHEPVCSCDARRFETERHQSICAVGDVCRSETGLQFGEDSVAFSRLPSPKKWLLTTIRG